MADGKIIVDDYKPEWALTFHKLKSIYESHLGNLVMDIQHVGSTSVYGLAAKPIIDVDLIIEDDNFLKPVINKLALLGYEHLGNLGITGREAFKRRSDKTPDDGSLRIWPKHNLYVCPKDSISLRNHLALRDYLRNNPKKAKEYAALKKRLASENPCDIDYYVEHKTPFITSILREVGFKDAELNAISEENKKP